MPGRASYAVLPPGLDPLVWVPNKEHDDDAFLLAGNSASLREELHTGLAYDWVLGSFLGEKQLLAAPWVAFSLRLATFHNLFLSISGNLFDFSNVETWKTFLLSSEALSLSRAELQETKRSR